MIQDNEVKFIDLRFTDTNGKEHHVTVPASIFDADKFEDGHPFDGSSIAGWKNIHASDMLLMPDPETAALDPFMEETTLLLTCDVIDPADGQGYNRDPRSLARRGETYLKSTGIGDIAYFGPELEFLFSIQYAGILICPVVLSRLNRKKLPGVPESATRAVTTATGLQSRGYMPVPPVDSLHDIRSAMCMVLDELGVPVEVHHHEVATAGQCEIGTRFNSLVKRADWNQLMKYVVHNIAVSYGKTATFMPKPIVGDNGSGMHVHQSIWKEGKTCLQGMAMRACPKPHSITLAALSGMPEH